MVSQNRMPLGSPGKVVLALQAMSQETCLELNVNRRGVLAMAFPDVFCTDVGFAISPHIASGRKFYVQDSLLFFLTG